MKITDLMYFKSKPTETTKQLIENEITGALKDLTPLIIKISLFLIPFALILNLKTNFSWLTKVFFLYIFQIFMTIAIMNMDKSLSRMKFKIVFVISAVLTTVPFIASFLAMVGKIPILASIIITLIYIPLIFNYGYLKQGY